ncbi:MAG: hypothetical protein ACNS62_16505, partial [Candidatus Cyclobacteriaceae bacterium M3_2C_046]
MNSPEKTIAPPPNVQKHANADPKLNHFMGIQMNVPIRQRMTRLFAKNLVRYRLADPTNPDKTRFLTMYGEKAVLDGEVSSAINCQHANKILAQFGSSEVAIQLFPDQLGGTGLIRTKEKEGASDAVTPILAFTEPGMRATIAVQKADQTWMENWGSLMVSPDENGQPKGSVIMSNNPTEQMPVAVTNDKSGALSFQIWLGSAVSSNGGYLEGDLTMSGNGLQGKMFLQTPNPKYDPDVQGSLKFNYIEVGTRAEWQNSNLHEDDLSSLQQKPDNALNAIDINHPHALWRFLSTDTELSIGELIGMTPPDNNDLHKAVCDGTMNCAILSVQQDWLKDLNLSKPSPLPELTKIATDPKNQEFFQKYFKAMGCSELAVDQMQEGWQSFSDGWQTVQSRMHYFWQGGATGCLARDKDFLRISEEIAQIYFSSMMGAFQRYLKLPQDQRTDWASKLLDAVTTPHMLMRLISSKECEAIHKYIIMLRALDQDGGFDKLFIKRINGAIQTQVANRMGSADITSVEEFLRKVLQHLMDPESDLKGDAFDNLRDDLNALKENDPTKWVGFTNSMTALAEELTNIALAYKNVPWQQKLKVWKDRILQKYGGDEQMVKVYSETGSLALTAVTVGFSTFALVGEIKEWSNLSPLQKTQTVLGTVQQVGTLGDQVYSFIKFIREPNAPVTVEMDLFRWNGDWDVLPEDAIGSDAYELRMAANAGNIGKYDIAAFAGPLEALTVVVTILS